MKHTSLNMEVKNVMGMYDVMPTIGNMLGIYNQYALGNDIFNTKENNIVVFPNGNWVTNKVYYNSQKGEYLSLVNEAISEEEIKQYYKELRNLSTNRISKDIVEKLTGESIEDIWQKIFQEEQKLRSNIFFPNDIIIMYPAIKEMKSKKLITCDFSGGLIFPGSLYVNYRPFIENITTNERYVLKRTLKVEPGYEHYLPRTITELEQLQENIRLESEDINDGINYSHLSQRTGGELVLQKLKRRKL